MKTDFDGFAKKLDRTGRGLEGLTRDLGRTRAAADGFAQSARSMAEASASFSPRESGGGGRSSGGSGSASSAASMGADLSGAFLQGLAPLNSLASKITAQINSVGGTITTLARRIDGHMKFDLAQASIEKLKARFTSDLAQMGLNAASATLKVKSYFENLGDVAGKSLDRASKVNLSAPTTGARTLGRQFAVMPGLVHATTASVKALGVQVALAAGAFGVIFKAVQAGIGFVKTGISDAANLGETMSKVSETFGAASGPVTALADDLSKRFGLVKGPMLDAAASIGLIAKGAKLGKVESAAMATSLTKLAADASSFYNVPMDAALDKIRSGLVGESEPLRAFGVLLSEDAVKAKALAMGAEKVKGKLDEQAKVMARAALITEGLATASGDLERTQGSAANQFRKVSGSIQNLGAAVGSVFLPVLQSGTGALGGFISTLATKFEANRATIQGWVASVGSGISTAAGLFNDLRVGITETFSRTMAIVKSWGIDFRGIFASASSFVSEAVTNMSIVFRNIPDFLELAGLKVGEIVMNMGARFDALKINLGILANYIAGNWRSIISDSITSLGSMFQALGTNIAGIVQAANDFIHGRAVKFDWTPITDGFMAQIDKIPRLVEPAFVSMEAEMNEVIERIGKNISAKVPASFAAAAAAIKPAAMKIETAAAKEGIEKRHGAGAFELGSKEAYNSIVKGMQGGDEKGPLKEAKVQTGVLKATLQVLKDIKAKGISNDAGLQPYTFA